MDYTVYRLTNQRNGKVYVGQTTMGVPERWTCHVCNAKTDTTPLARAIRKHGREAFAVETLMECDDAASLDAAERFWIWRLKSQVPAGYNLTDGGNCGTKQTAVTCAKKSRSQTKRYSLPLERYAQTTRLRAIHADPEIQARRAASIRAYWTPERRAEAAKRPPVRIPTAEERAAGHAVWRIRVIASRDGTDQEFASSREAARALGVHESAVSQCLHGKAGSAGGYTFRRK